MNVLNYGSLNIDLVYRLPHIVRPGETLSSLSLERFAGGKGNNQSIALAKAGVKVFHAGRVGPDGAWLVRNLKEAGADVRHIREDKGPTGHAVIQVADSGQNSIVLFPGANHTLGKAEVAQTIRSFKKGDVLLLQNEINNMAEIMKQAHRAGLSIWFNPAPFSPAVLKYPLHLVDLFIVNEIEGTDLAGVNSESKALATLARKFPKARILMTLGSRGAILKEGTQEWRAKAPKVKAVDTTAAGDTFIGYFAASLIKGFGPEQCLAYACKAASISVTRKGAAASIPSQSEVF